MEENAENTKDKKKIMKSKFSPRFLRVFLRVSAVNWGFYARHPQTVTTGPSPGHGI